MLKLFITLIFIYNLPLLFMGYAFTGKEIYIFMIIVFSYSIYSIFAKKILTILDLLVYLTGIIYTSKELYRYILEYGYKYDDHTVTYLLTIVSFLILTYISINKNLNFKDRGIS